MFRSLRHKLDPLDREILEEAFDATWDAVKGNDLSVDFDSDEGPRSHPPTRADRDCLLQWRERPQNPPRHPVDSSAVGQTSTVKRRARAGVDRAGAEVSELSFSQPDMSAGTSLGPLRSHKNLYWRGVAWGDLGLVP